MAISEISNQYPAFERLSQTASISLEYATDLSLRTAEGDLVNISFQNEQSLTESESQTRFADDVAIREISSVAVAASRYSLSVQGDLNDEELAAIQRLVEGIEPIARDFFARGEFDFENATGVLAGSLGVIDEVELELERVITATFSSQTLISGAPNQANDPVSTAPANPSQQPPIDTDNIRNLSDLIFSAIEAEFESQAAVLPESEAILKSLNDLVLFLQKQLGQVLTPLESTVEPASTAPLPQETGTDFTPPEELQA
jgi:hypothetical protein